MQKVKSGWLHAQAVSAPHSPEASLGRGSTGSGATAAAAAAATLHGTLGSASKNDTGTLKRSSLFSSTLQKKAHKRRWFVFDGTRLSSYKNEKALDAISSFDLSHALDCEETPQIAQHSLEILLPDDQLPTTNAIQLHVIAESRAEMLEWLALFLACQRSASGEDEVSTRKAAEEPTAFAAQSFLSFPDALQRPADGDAPDALLGASMPTLMMRCAKRGSLYMSTEHGKTWTRRRFVLTSWHLFFMDAWEARAPAGYVCLDPRCTVLFACWPPAAASTDEDAAVPLPGFALETDSSVSTSGSVKRKVAFMASNEEERREWVTLLRRQSVQNLLHIHRTGVAPCTCSRAAGASTASTLRTPHATSTESTAAAVAAAASAAAAAAAAATQSARTTQSSNTGTSGSKVSSGGARSLSRRASVDSLASEELSDGAHQDSVQSAQSVSHRAAATPLPRSRLTRSISQLNLSLFEHRPSAKHLAEEAQEFATPTLSMFPSASGFARSADALLQLQQQRRGSDSPSEPHVSLLSDSDSAVSLSSTKLRNFSLPTIREAGGSARPSQSSFFVSSVAPGAAHGSEARSDADASNTEDEDGYEEAHRRKPPATTSNPASPDPQPHHKHWGKQFSRRLLNLH